VLAIVQLSHQSNLYPECLAVKGVHKLDMDPVAGGAYGDVFKGIMQSDPVAIKVLRRHQNFDMDIIKVCPYFLMWWHIKDKIYIEIFS